MLKQLEDLIAQCDTDARLDFFRGEFVSLRARLQAGEPEATIGKEMDECVQKAKSVSLNNVNSVAAIRQAANMPALVLAGAQPQPGGPTTPSNPPPMPKTGGPPSGGPRPLAMKPAAQTPFKGGPRANPVGRDTPTSKAFKAKVKPDMFDPDGLDPGTLDAECLKFNFALSNAKKVVGTSDLFTVIVQAGVPERGTMGQVKATQLDALTKMIWTAFNATLTTPETFPTVEKILEMQVEWKKNDPPKPEDDISKHRASTINGARVDVTKPKQVLIAAADLEKANQGLRDSGSFIQLEKAGPDNAGFFPVRPVFGTANQAKPDPREREDHTVVQSLNQARQGKVTSGTTPTADQTFVSWADCHRTAQMVMGSEDQPLGTGDLERPVLRGRKGEIVVDPIPVEAAQFIPGASNSGANRAMHGFFNRAVPDFLKEFATKDRSTLTPGQARVVDSAREAERERDQQVTAVNLKARWTAANTKLQKQKDDKYDEREEAVKTIGRGLEGVKDDSPDRLANRDRELATVRADLEKLEKELAIVPEPDKKRDIPANFRSVYRDICDDPDLYDKFSQDYGVNAYVKPQVGDAITQVNDEMMKVAGEKAGKDIWNFHWAGVVMVNPDGSYMTMENLSVEDLRAVNTDWYFAVYQPGGATPTAGKPGQKGADFKPANTSFHEVNKADTHVANYPLTMAVKKVA